MKISLNTFLKFISSTGSGKSQAVTEARGNWEKRADYWLKARHVLIDALKSGVLETGISSQISSRKRSHYTQCFEGLSTFMKKHSVKWLGCPEPTIWMAKNLAIRINPEALLEIDGERYLVKMHLGERRLPQFALRALHLLLRECYEGMNVKTAVLDVRRAQLIVLPDPTKNTRAVLIAEAASFVVLWTEAA